MPLVAAVRDRLRAELLLRDQRRDPRLKAWAQDVQDDPMKGYARVCIICGWHGQSFLGSSHCESATCPGCGSVARDRFMYHCFVKRVPYRAGMRVLETSPRLGADYRAVMRQRCAYLSSDYDRRAHLSDAALDLQQLGLASEALEVILTAHVLEHVPDTSAGLQELWRVLKPGGTMLLSVPVLQGVTAPPTEPEFHGDNTPVFWRFGFDLTDQLRRQGFRTSVLVPGGLLAEVKRRTGRWAVHSPEFDPPSILSAADPADMVAIADERITRRMGFEPEFMFVVWECVKP
jgi:SAM-dependent methyltransferase